MPRNYPPVPDYSDPAARAEAMVWQALQELPEDAVVFAQARVQDKRRVTREADFLVAWPGVGVAILEVKGGLVWCDGSTGTARMLAAGIMTSGIRSIRPT